MSARTLLGLIVCNLIWSAHPLMGKWLLESVSPEQGAWMRYSSALLFYFIAVLVIHWVRAQKIQWKSVFISQPLLENYRENNVVNSVCCH